MMWLKGKLGRFVQLPQTPKNPKLFLVKYMNRNLLIGIIVVVIIVLGGIGYFLMQPPSGPTTKDTIVIGTTDKVISLDPAEAYDYMSINVIQNVMDGLFRYRIGTTELEPDLAESYTVSDDGLVYTLNIRQGVTFHDGSPLNATVVKWSIDRAIQMNGDPAFLLSEVVNRTEVTGPYQVKIYLKYPFSAFPSILAFSVAYPVTPTAYSTDEFMTDNIVGTGPFKLVEFVRDQKIVLERNDNYWDPTYKPKVKRIVIMFYETSTALKQALDSGQIDIAYRTLTPEDINGYINNNGTNFYILEAPSPVIRYLVINVNRVTNVKVRQALAAAVNRTAIVEQVFLGQAENLYSMIPKGMWSHIDAFLSQYGEANITLARQLLQEAGYSETNKLEIDLWYTPTHYGPTEEDVAQVIKTAWESTGMITVNVRSAEWAQYRDNWRNGVMDVFLLGWYPDYLDPDDYVFPFLHSSGAASLGSFYNDSTMDKLLEDARKTSNITERTELYKQVQEKLAVDVPYIPLWQAKQYVVFKIGIKGVILDATQIFRYYTLYWEESGSSGTQGSIITTYVSRKLI